MWNLLTKGFIRGLILGGPLGFVGLALYGLFCASAPFPYVESSWALLIQYALIGAVTGLIVGAVTGFLIGLIVGLIRMLRGSDGLTQST